MKMLVVADDLTGALDVGAEFGKRGVPTLVSVDRDIDLQEAWQRYRVVAVDAESRHLSPTDAAERVGQIVERARNAGATHFFKKTDSTLRGNVGSELEAMLANAGGGFIAYVAAAPLYGRTTRRGLQYVGEKLLHESPFAQDPLEPITESHVPTILSRQTHLPVAMIQSSELRGSDEGVAGKLELQGIVVFDACSESDVADVTNCLARCGKLRVLGGTARFASHLADALGMKVAPSDPVHFRPGLLIVNGSVNETALDQVRRARASGTLRLIEMSPEFLFAESAASREMEEAAIVAAAVGSSERVLLHSAMDRDDLGHYDKVARAHGLSGRELHMAVAERTAELVCRLAREYQFGLITVIGGDTLAALTRAMKWSGFSLRGEIAPGVALAEVDGESGMFVAAKPGGFGPPDIIESIDEFYTARR